MVEISVEEFRYSDSVEKT